MRMVIRSLSAAVLTLCAGAAHLSAQQPGNGAYQWYIGGQGGIMNFETPVQGRTTLPLGGAHLLVTAKRTGLLLSVEQGFGSDEQSGYTFTVLDSLNQISSQSAVPVNFNYLRKYSAMLMAFPVRGPATPFFGIGGGILHTGGHTPDGGVGEFGSTGFGSLLAGLNFRVSRFSAFGQYQVTTGPRTRSFSSHDDETNETFISSGSLLTGPVHTFTAGLRFGLGNAREDVRGGGY